MCRFGLCSYIFLNLPVIGHFLSVWLSDEKECVTMSHLLPVGEPKYIVLSWVKQRPAQKIILVVTVNTWYKKDVNEVSSYTLTF